MSVARAPFDTNLLSIATGGREVGLLASVACKPTAQPPVSYIFSNVQSVTLRKKFKVACSLVSEATILH